MYVEILYYGLISLVFLCGIIFMFRGLCVSSSIMPINYRAGPTYRLGRLRAAFTDSKQDQIFASAGINLSMGKYMAWRKVIIWVFLLAAVIKLMESDMTAVRKYLITVLFLYLLSYPKESFRGKKTPFYHVLLIMKKRKADAMDEELTGIIMQMKNIIISSDREVSANYIFMRLLPFTKLTNKAFSLALMYIRHGDIKKAGEAFREAFDTKLGDMFSSILAKLEELPAREFLEQLDMTVKKADAEHKTRREAEKVRVNTTRRLFAVIESVLIMVNFVYLILIDTLLVMNF